MNVLYIIGRFPAISETFILNEIIEVINCGHNVCIVSLNLPEDKIFHDNFKMVKDKTIYLSQVDMWGKFLAVLWYFLRLPANFMQVTVSCYREDYWKIGVLRRLLNSSFLARYVKRLKIDHIHSHFANEPTSYAMWTSMLTGIPYTFTTHGHDIFCEPPGNYAEKLQRSKFMITISNFNREYLIKELQLDGEKIVVNRCGVNVSNFTPKERENIRPNRPMILTIARLHPIKALECLIETYRILKASGVVFKGIIIGEGKERKNLENLIRKYSLTENVKLIGAKTQLEIVSYLKKSAIFVLPSRSEGLPIVIMEALASGIPVIASNIAGIPEIVHNDKSGYLVPVGDSHKLAEKIKELLLDEEKRTKFGQYGRRLVEKDFSLKKQVCRLIDLWQR